MIETPADPKPRTIPAPPPDPTQRQVLPAAPPDASALHDRACRHCASPLHGDQLACLVCGRMADDAVGLASRRKWGLTSVAVLLLVGGAVGAAVAGLPHGKNVKKPSPIAKALAPKKPIPPATDPSTAPTTPLPGSGDTPKPPKIHTPKSRSTPLPSPSGGSPSSGSPGTTSGSPAPPRGGNGGGAKPEQKKHAPATTPGASSQLFADGVAPEDGQLFDPNGDGRDNPADVVNTYDNHSDTAWRSGQYPNGFGKPGVGIWVKAPSSSTTRGIGILTRTAGFDASVYYSNASAPPAQLNDGWTLAAERDGVATRRRVALKGAARNAKYDLLWITKLPKGKQRVALSEIQLLQR
jgi:hypothetical protein